jgi:hypothetical protein
MNSADKLRWSDIGREQALEGIDPTKHLKPVQGCGLKLVVRGSRHYELVSSFGSLRAEDCAILQSGTDQGFPVVALKDELRRSAAATRMLAGRDVFVFPSTIVTEPWVRRAPWEGVYFVVLDAKTLLFATSDRYLREVLERIDSAPTTRALPARLPEWGHVDVTTSCWMLRHFPSAGKNWGTVGTTTRWTDDRFEVVYVAGSASTPDLDQIERFWFPDEPTPEQRRKFRLERRPDGAVALATTAPPDIAADLLIWGFQTCRLKALELFGTR